MLAPLDDPLQRPREFLRITCGLLNTTDGFHNHHRHRKQGPEAAKRQHLEAEEGRRHGGLTVGANAFQASASPFQREISSYALGKDAAVVVLLEAAVVVLLEAAVVVLLDAALTVLPDERKKRLHTNQGL